MASSVYIGHAITKILLDRRMHSIRSLANGLEVSKDAVANHVAEMESLGLVRITSGRYGGVLWIAD